MKKHALLKQRKDTIQKVLTVQFPVYPSMYFLYVYEYASPLFYTWVHTVHIFLSLAFLTLQHNMMHLSLSEEGFLRKLFNIWSCKTMDGKQIFLFEGFL